ncbi:glycoside hydrolase family 26 protein [Teichococcus oryzae]|uniref:Glycosidase n=2 Tax=Pseudomonadota TaxID=1224 RepID=A0A5B2TLZ7_9PROT|nr:glycosyl hydrolase [Pseudoroseomonas oryzae]KAA2215035.1 glycosidase [Pseudoroseomonas oryzae]
MRDAAKPAQAQPVAPIARRPFRSRRLGMLAAALATLPLLAAPASATPLSTYAANDPKLVDRFEKWLGCPVDFLMVFTDQASWEGIGWPQWFIDQFKMLDKPTLWSVAMIPRQSSLKEAATGKYNRYYVSAARALAKTKPFPDGTIRVRLGWEMNGNWFPWSASGKEEDFVRTFRHIVDSFRSVSDKFRFEWNVNYGQRMDVMKAYPGDNYVDILGMDFYWKPEYLGRDPVRAFEKIRDDRVGLRWLEDLAKAKGKPTAYSEWGVQSDNAGPFIKLVRDWIAAHPNVLYTNYWNHDADYEGDLSAGRWPATEAAFRQAFCPRPGQPAQILRDR